jgi:hypothetical protein
VAPRHDHHRAHRHVHELPSSQSSRRRPPPCSQDGHQSTLDQGQLTAAKGAAVPAPDRLEVDVNTFFGHLELSALLYLDGHLGLVTRSFVAVLDLLNDIVALEHFTKDNVLAVEPARNDGGDEELRAIGVAAGVGHAEEALLGVLELEVLVIEAVAVDRLAAGAIALGEVTTLNHEVLDNAVEAGALVAEALLAGGKHTEVLSSLRGLGLAVSWARFAFSPLALSCHRDQVRYGPALHHLAECRSRPCV